MKFNRIIAVDKLGLTKEVYEKLEDFCDEIVFYNQEMIDDEKLIEIVKDSECILVSWDTVISRYVIENCQNLKYIGMCCSLFDEKSANVDLKAAKENNILVYGVKSYGDKGVVEYILSETIRLIHGYGKHQWREKELELTDLKVGIIGMGNTGYLVGNAFSYFGSDVYYYSRNRKEEIEQFTYMDLDELLERVDILTTHLPKNSKLLTQKHFKKFGDGKILINTSIGDTYDIDALKFWLENKNNYLICDLVGAGDRKEEFLSFDNIIYTDKVCATTTKSNDRLSQTVLDNLKKAIKAIKSF